MDFSHPEYTDTTPINDVMKMEQSAVTLSSENEIQVDGTTVGFIESGGEYGQTIMHIEIFPEFRGHEYSKAATEAFIGRVQETPADSVNTSVVVSSTYQHHLLDIGFERVSPMENEYKFEL